eukprot:4639135-Prymnesium_polylepis.1
MSRIVLDRAGGGLEDLRGAHVGVGDHLGAAELDHRVLEEGRVGAQAAEHGVVLDRRLPHQG